MLSLLVLAQITATFSAQLQDPAVPKVTQWSVMVCNSGAESRVLSGGLVYKAASPHLGWVTTVEALRIAGKTRRRSPAAVLGIVAEIGAWSLTAAQAMELVKIRERWRAIPPVAGGAIEMARALVRKENPEWRLPGNVLPTSITLGPGGCAEHVIFALQPSGTFTVEVAP